MYLLSTPLSPPRFTEVARAQWGIGKLGCIGFWT